MGFVLILATFFRVNSMGMIFIDPFLSLANLVWAITFLVIIWRLLGVLVDNSEQIQAKTSQKTGLYWSLLLIVYAFLSVHTFLADYLHFTDQTSIQHTRPNNHVYDANQTGGMLSLSGYVMKTSHVLSIQGLSICTAGLLWLIPHSIQQGKLIYWGFYLQIVGIFIHCVSFHLTHVPTHWIQMTEIIVTTFLLTTLPIMALLFFRYQLKPLLSLAKPPE